MYSLVALCLSESVRGGSVLWLRLLLLLVVMALMSLFVFVLWFHVCSRNSVKWKMLAGRGKKQVVFLALFIGFYI